MKYQFIEFSFLVTCYRYDFQIGLIQTETIRRPQQLAVPPVQETSKAYLLPSGIPGEDFWLEFRDGYRWDAYIGGTGLVVYHIDKSTNMAGSMNARLRWSANAVNGCAAHPCAVFVGSDAGNALDVKDAFYPGYRNVRDIHSASNFPLTGWNGKGIGLGLSDIVREADGIRCNVVNDDSWDLPVVTGWSIVPAQISALLEWQSDKSSSGQWELRWGILNGYLCDITCKRVNIGYDLTAICMNRVAIRWSYNFDLHAWVEDNAISTDFLCNCNSEQCHSSIRF